MVTKHIGLKELGRLALREEDQWWVAYHALPTTMDGAVELGRIAMKFVNGTKQAHIRKHEFLMLMQSVFSDIAEEIIGIRPIWPEGPQPAPEHERKR